MLRYFSSSGIKTRGQVALVYLEVLIGNLMSLHGVDELYLYPMIANAIDKVANVAGEDFSKPRKEDLSPFREADDDTFDEKLYCFVGVPPGSPLSLNQIDLVLQGVIKAPEFYMFFFKDCEMITDPDAVYEDEAEEADDSDDDAEQSEY